MTDLWAKIKKGKNFTGAKAGEIYPTTFTDGEIVDGNLAKIAIEEGVAMEGKGERPPVLDEKMMSGAPENKDASAIGERVVYLQGENATLASIIDQQKTILAVLGVDAEFAEQLSTVEVPKEQIDEFTKKIEAARAAKVTEPVKPKTTAKTGASK